MQTVTIRKDMYRIDKITSIEARPGDPDIGTKPYIYIGLEHGGARTYRCRSYEEADEERSIIVGKVRFLLNMVKL